MALAVLLMPVYVFKHQRALQRPLVPFWSYLFAFVAIVALQFTSGAVNAIETRVP